MGDAGLNNEEFFIINREVHWQLITCPVCEASHFRTYSQLLRHLIWPPNCLNNVDQGVPVQEGGQIGPVLVPVPLPLRVMLMIMWSILWLCYIIIFYVILIGIPLLVTFLVQLARNAFTGGDAPRLAPAGGYRAYIVETANVCMQYIQFIAVLFYQEAVAFFVIVAGFFGRVYQGTRDFIPIALAACGHFIIRGLYATYRYLLVAPYRAVFDAIVSFLLTLDGLLNTVVQYIVNALALFFQAVQLAYQRYIQAPLIRFHISCILPLVNYGRYLIAVVELFLQQVRQLFFVRIPASIDAVIGVEIALAQGTANAIENFGQRVYGGIEWLNSAMYTFVWFPVDIPAGTPTWKSFIYYIFFFIHVTALVYLFICSYIQLATLYLLVINQ